MKAYLYGSEIQILEFYTTKRCGIPYCKVRIIETGWVEKCPMSCIEIR